jgi:Flp pilus assembly protein TadD
MTVNGLSYYELKTNLVQLKSSLRMLLCLVANWVDEAVHALSIATLQNPSDSMSWNVLARVLQNKRGAVELSIIAFRAILDLEPDRGTTHNMLAISLSRKGDSQGAIASHKRAIAINADHANAHYNLACELVKVNDPAGAIESVNNALRANGQHYDYSVLRATALASVGRFVDALVSFRQAQELVASESPTERQRVNSMVHYGMARVYEALGDYATAIPLLREKTLHGAGARWQAPSEALLRCEHVISGASTPVQNTPPRFTGIWCQPPGRGADDTYCGVELQGPLRAVLVPVNKHMLFETSERMPPRTLGGREVSFGFVHESGVAQGLMNEAINQARSPDIAAAARNSSVWNFVNSSVPGPSPDADAD